MEVGRILAGVSAGLIRVESNAALQRIVLLWLVIIVASLLAAATCVSATSAKPIQTRAGAVKEFCARAPLTVGPSRFQAALRVSSDVARAGGQLRMRVDNLGTETISYGYAYRLERRRKGTWLRQPAKPVFGPKLYLEGGRAGACQTFQIGEDAAPGRYRVSKTVTTAESSESKTLRAIFQVGKMRADHGDSGAPVCPDLNLIVGP